MMMIDDGGEFAWPYDVPWFDQINCKINAPGSLGFCELTAPPEFFEEVGWDVISYMLQFVFWVYTHTL